MKRSIRYRLTLQKLIGWESGLSSRLMGTGYDLRKERERSPSVEVVCGGCRDKLGLMLSLKEDSHFDCNPGNII